MKQCSQASDHAEMQAALFDKAVLNALRCRNLLLAAARITIANIRDVENEWGMAFDTIALDAAIAECDQAQMKET